MDNVISTLALFEKLVLILLALIAIIYVATKNKNTKKRRFQLSKVFLPANFELSEDYLNVLKKLENTNQNYFVTGEAGTGKTTLIHYIRQKSKKEIVVLAPTGVAAISSRGQTIHSFFRFPPRLIQKQHIRPVYNARRLFDRLELLIIDEASMVRADLLDGIDCALRINREMYDSPFGGVQVALFGDLYQLPPVVTRLEADAFSQIYETPYFFSANVFKESHFKSLVLNKIYRQKDQRLQHLLGKLRNGNLSQEDLSIINSRVAHRAPTGRIDNISLTPTNAAANAINFNELKKLDRKEHIYEALVEGDFEPTFYPTDIKLRLKVGAKIILIKNHPDKLWVNGTLVTIVELQNNFIKARTKMGEYEVQKETWEKIRYKFDPSTKTIVEEVIGTFKQYPLKLAWAITIHKSQGLTFDQLTIDLDHGAFTHGQVYVALSRCRTLEGIYLERPLTNRDIIFDERVLNVKSLLN